MSPYFEDGSVSIYHGDCREVLPWLGLSCAAVVTDPPYGTESLGGGYGRRQLADPEGRNGHTIENDHDLSALAKALPAITAALIQGGWMVTFAAARRRWEAESLLVAAGLNLYGEIVWDKGAPGLGYTIRYSHEGAIVAVRGEARAPQRPLLSVLRIPREERAMNGRHPHEKPTALMVHLVEFASAPGGLVLDPFCGSGSTLVAAKALGRKAIGIEVDERWCESAVGRLAQRSIFEIAHHLRCDDHGNYWGDASGAICPECSQGALFEPTK